MTRVDFYVLPESSHWQRFVCGLAGKAVKNGCRVYIHVTEDSVAISLDDLLWTYSDTGFIPHALAKDNSAPDCPVLIGTDSKICGKFDVMINLSDSVPDDAEQYSRIAEVVAGDDAMRNRARERYRDYRSRNYELHSHTIDRI